MFTLLKEKFNDHFTFFYKKNAIEIVPVGINKGKALQYLISTNNIEEKDVFVVGDGPNDIPMFELFENSFAMIPCDNRLKRLAKHTINKFSDLKEYTKLDNNLHWGNNMNNTNYVLFEIIKFKIEFLDCLEYSLISENQKINDEVKNNFLYLRNELKNGLYKDITSSLFNSYKTVNKPIIKFVKSYNNKKIDKIIKNKKLNKILEYNENIIDCYENFNHIIASFTEEKEIRKNISNKILNLLEVSNKHFINFLFFNSYNLYLNCFYNKNINMIYIEKDIERLIKIINYANSDKSFEKSIDILKEENEEEIYKELENLSNICIKLEKDQHTQLNELIAQINNETKKE